MNPSDRTTPAQFNNAQANKIAKAVQRINALPYGRARGTSTYSPGITTHVIGRLTEPLYFDEAGRFKQYASDDPTDENDAESELSYDAEKCFNWAFLDYGKMLPSNAKVELFWHGGRWYVCNGPCPDDDDRESEEE